VPRTRLIVGPYTQHLDRSQYEYGPIAQSDRKLHPAYDGDTDSEPKRQPKNLWCLKFKEFSLRTLRISAFSALKAA
jgi:hypothetical protein